MNDLTTIPQWDPNSGAALPAYITEAMEDLGTNIPERNTVPSLSYEGKTWQIVKDGNKTKLQSKNNDGDMVPIPVMRIILLNFNAERGRAYYPGTYNPSQVSAPTCWSADGKAPDPSVKEKQHSVCQGCPQSVKGSKVQDGKEMVACSSHRLLAVAPAFEIESEPLRLKIAVTSDYDKEIVEHGWFALRQYVDFLKSRGISHTGMVVTKIKFDSNVAYPKLLFALDRLLSAEEIQQVRRAGANPKVKELLSENWTPAGVDGTQTDGSDMQPHGLEGAYADGWQAHPDAAGWSWKGQEVIKNEDLAARYPAPEPAAAPPVPTASAPPVPASQQTIEHAPAAKPEPVKGPSGLEAAVQDGWTAHPDAPGYHYKGQEVKTDAEVAAMYPDATVSAADAGFAGGNASAPAAAATPPASTENVATAAPAASAPPISAGSTTLDPVKAAEADGWIAHPDAPGYHYKGQEVVPTADLAGKYPAASAGTTPAPAPASTPASPSTPSDSGQTATTTASPSDAIPADVQGLLDKWTQ